LNIEQIKNIRTKVAKRYNKGESNKIKNKTDIKFVSKDEVIDGI
jgi:hypothetical protein